MIPCNGGCSRKLPRVNVLSELKNMIVLISDLFELLPFVYAPEERSDEASMLE